MELSVSFYDKSTNGRKACIFKAIASANLSQVDTPITIIMISQEVQGNDIKD
jgi:hypothetical protein